MRLLTYDDRGELCTIKDIADDDVPPYAILSHTWGQDEEEVTLHEIGTVAGRRKAGYQKIEFCGRQALRDGYQYFWVDTCCIDKTNQVELSQAITSMWRWYQQAQVCYVYLTDVSYSQDDLAAAVAAPRPWEASFRQSRWFNRGWTLQELLAPREVVFYSRGGSRLGTKSELRDLLHDITGIPTAALDGQPLSQFPVIERMRWTQGRKTKEKEDQAYCLLGIFEVYMPLVYGEGDYAFRRLQKEIDDRIYHESSRQRSEVRHLGLCLTSMPLIQPEEFVGRAAELNTIYDVLRPEEAAVQQRRVVVTGIGGVGKTQLVAAYARRYTSSYTSIIWLNATSELTLYNSLRSLASSLITAGELRRLNNEHVLARLLEWLSETNNTRWLLVFDNYDDPDQFDIQRFYPTIGHGSVIITTRLPDQVTGSPIRVGPFTAIDDSLGILQAHSGREDVRNDIGARRLAERMAGLPLALVTAGASLRKTTLSFQQYLDVYEQHWQVNRRNLQLRGYTDYTLYTAWNLLYSWLQAEDTEAAQMLKLLAYFDHQSIWYELVRAGLSDDSPQWLTTCSAEQIDFESVMGRLVDFCFVEVQLTTSSYSIHSCVHDWALSELNRDVDPTLYWYAFDCVATSIDRSDFNALGVIQNARISRHGVRLAHRQFGPCDEAGLSTRLRDFIWIAEMLTQQVQLSAAEQIYRRALYGYEKALGPGHTSTLMAVNNLGNLCHDQGKLDEAEQMYRRALAGTEKALGPDHTSTLDIVNNLSSLYRHQGKLDEAEQMYRRALAGQEKALGPDHSSTLTTVNNLGNLYATQGKLGEAEQILYRALAGRERALGPDHTDTLQTVNNLGNLYRAQGKLDAAEQMYTRALAGKVKALGPDHTSTLTTINNLGNLYRAQGRLDKVEQMLIQGPNGREKQTPADHDAESLGRTSWKDSTYESALQATQSYAYRSLGKAAEAVKKVMDDIQTDSAIESSLTRPEIGQYHEQALFIAETKYAPSAASDLPELQNDAYIVDFAKDLYDTVRIHDPNSKSLQQVLHVLPGILKAFAQKIGNNAEDQIYKDISYFFQRSRHDIRNMFKRLFESESFRPGAFAINRFLTTVDATTYEDIKMTNTHGAADIQQDITSSEGEESIDLPSEGVRAAPVMAMYRNIITSSAAYEWLVMTLHRELNVTRAQPDIMDHVGYSVSSYLPTSCEVSRKVPVTQCKVLLEFDWNPLTFVAEQKYTESPHVALERAITLTGSAHDAQAATTQDYLVQTWPATGDLIMQMIKEAICAQDHCATSNLQDGTKVKVQFLAKSISTVEIFGPCTSIAEIAEQFLWLGAALRSSPFEDGIAMCTPRVQDVQGSLLGQTASRLESDSCTILKVYFDVVKIMPNTSLPGNCWHAMFRNPVIVRGYPILAKGSQGKGIEMPLSMIAKLARAEKVNQFNGSVFLKGFSTMLLAVQLNKNVLIWHHLYNAHGGRISYLDHDVQSTASIALHQLKTVRHVVGWCKASEYHAGAATANYDIGETGLEPPHAGCLLEKVSIGGGKFIIASLTFALGVRDTPPHLTSNGYLNKLISIATEYFVLWDEGDKRGWLVNGASALLHLVKTSLHHYSKEYPFAFIFDFDQMKHPDMLKPSSATEILFENRGLVVFPDRRGESEEISKEQVGSSTFEKQVLKKREDYFLFGDLVEQHWENLELIVDCHRYVAGKNGINVKTRVRKYLEGWDFIELATDHKHLNPRVATLSALGYGWVDFVRSIHAIPLFGRGFGDIIKPAISNDGMCPRWSTLPKNKYYLAVSMYDMNRVTAKHGNKHADPPIPVHGLIWHCPEKLLALCKCQQHPGQLRRSTKQKHHDPVQIFCPTKSKLLLRVKGPGNLYEDGAVVFGHSISWGYQWQEHGENDLEKEQKLQSEPVPEPVLRPNPAVLDSHLPTLDPSLLMPQSSSHSRGLSNHLDRTATSRSSSSRSRVYTIGNPSLQTSERSTLRMGFLVDSQTTASTTSRPSTNTTNIAPASSRPTDTLDKQERKQKSEPISEQAQQTAQQAAAAASENAIASSSRVKSKTRKHYWQRFLKRKTT